MRSGRIFPALAVAALLAGCQDQPAAPGGDTPEALLSNSKGATHSTETIEGEFNLCGFDVVDYTGELHQIDRFEADGSTGLHYVSNHHYRLWLSGRETGYTWRYEHIANAQDQWDDSDWAPDSWFIINAHMRVIGLGRAPDFDGTIRDKWQVNANGEVTARILKIEPTCAPAGEWLISTYYWDDGWVKYAAWDGSYLGTDVKISFDAWNWQPNYPANNVDFDNVYAFGDLDVPEGLVDDFNDGSIAPIWTEYGDQWVGDTEVYEADGVLNVDIPFGTNSQGTNHVGGLHTDYLIHGEFDVQIDFALSPDFHSLPCCAHIKLRLIDRAFGLDPRESWAGVSMGRGRYCTGEMNPRGLFGHGCAATSDVVGKLRITRTRVAP
ncbi:MAG: hypothetical protein ACYTAO_05875 [Planctomycetota bacterium]|jgi:hypothetical protein